MNEMDNIIVLTDEDGMDVRFEFLDVVFWQEKEYVVLLPVDDGGDGLVVIFRVEGDGDDETYVGIDNEVEAEAVFAAFKAKNREVFNFLD